MNLKRPGTLTAIAAGAGFIALGSTGWFTPNTLEKRGVVEWDSPDGTHHVESVSLNDIRKCAVKTGLPSVWDGEQLSPTFIRQVDNCLAEHITDGECTNSTHNPAEAGEGTALVKLSGHDYDLYSHSL